MAISARRRSAALFASRNRAIPTTTIVTIIDEPRRRVSSGRAGVSPRRLTPSPPTSTPMHENGPGGLEPGFTLARALRCVGG